MIFFNFEIIMYQVFGFWSLLAMNMNVIFVYILQGKMGKMEKRKENHATKVTKIPKTKRRKYGMNETFVTMAVIGTLDQSTTDPKRT